MAMKQRSQCKQIFCPFIHPTSIRDQKDNFFSEGYVALWYLMVSKKNNHYLCKDGIEKSVASDHRVTVCHHSACSVMPNGDSLDKCFYPILTLILDSLIIVLFSW